MKTPEHRSDPLAAHVESPATVLRAPTRLDLNSRATAGGVVVAAGVGLIVAGVITGVPGVATGVIALAGLLMLIAGTTCPQVGLWLLVAIIYTNASDVLIEFHGAPSIADPLIAMLLFVIAVRLFLGERVPNHLVAVAAALGVYILIGISTLFHAGDYGLAKAGVIGLAKSVVIVFLVVMLLRTTSALRGAIWVLLWVGIVIGTITVVQFLTGSFEEDFAGFSQALVEITSLSTTRPGGGFGDPNFFAQSLVVLIPLSLERLLNERSMFLRVLAGWALVASLGAIVLTFSRGGWFALAVAAVASGFAFRRRLWRFRFVALAALPLLFVVLTPATFQRLDTVPTAVVNLTTDIDLEEDRAIRRRTSSLLAGALMFRDHPITGVGLGNFEARYLEYSSPLGIDRAAREQSAHSLYLEIAAETGVLGLIAFGGLVLLAFRWIGSTQRRLRQRGARRDAEMVTALGIGFAAFLVAGIFLQLSYPKMFWLLLAITFALPSVVADRDPLRQYDDDRTNGRSASPR